MNSEVQDLIERWPLVTHYNLPPESNVLVIGSYKGLAIEAIDDLWHPASIRGYDPQIWACDEARARLKDRPNCEIHEYGLGRYNTTLPMGEWHTDACSFINVGEGSRQQGVGHVWNAHDVLKVDFPTGNIDLVQLNCEGDEFNLIPYLREKGWLKRINRLAVQWHLRIGPIPQKSEDDMDREIGLLIDEDGYSLVWDERPSWTLLVKNA